VTVILQSSVSSDHADRVAQRTQGSTDPAQNSGRKFKIPYSALKHVLASIDAAVIIGASLVGGAFYQIIASGDLLRLDPLLGVGR
jgi:hypothetical protein